MSADDLFISPSKISKQGKRYYIEIPKSMADTAEQLHSKPVTVSINLIARRKSWSDQVFADVNEKANFNSKTMSEINERYSVDIAPQDAVNLANDLLRCFNKDTKKEIKKPA